MGLRLGTAHCRDRSHGELTYPEECGGFPARSSGGTKDDLSSPMDLRRTRAIPGRLDPWLIPALSAGRKVSSVCGLLSRHPDHPPCPRCSTRARAIQQCPTSLFQSGGASQGCGGLCARTVRSSIEKLIGDRENSFCPGYRFPRLSVIAEISDILVEGSRSVKLCD